MKPASTAGPLPSKKPSWISTWLWLLEFTAFYLALHIADGSLLVQQSLKHGGRAGAQATARISAVPADIKVGTLAAGSISCFNTVGAGFISSYSLWVCRRGDC